MNTRTFQTLAILGCCAAAAGTAQASDQPDPWSVALIAGDSMALHGSLRAPLKTTVADLGALDPAMVGQAGTADLHRLRYDRLFNPDFNAGLELGYAFDDALQAYGRIGYGHLDGRVRDIGQVARESPADVGELRAHMNDVHDESLEAGARYTWQTGSDWRPYAGVALGADRVDGMRGSLTLQAASAVPEHVRFTRGDTVFSQSLETGVEYDPGNNFGLRIGVEADHSGVASNAHDPKLLALGYDRDNDAQARWAFPVAVAATWRF